MKFRNYFVLGLLSLAFSANGLHYVNEVFSVDQSNSLISLTEQCDFQKIDSAIERLEQSEQSQEIIGALSELKDEI
nr:hypothetical protein [Alphaproteobacteria bacterium]